MQSVPGSLNLIWLDQLYLCAQIMGMGKLNHLAGIRNAANQ
jgi:hypothetical protein